MAGINLSQLNIPKSEEPVKRKHVIRLDELSDAYSNPEKKQEGLDNEPVKKGELKKPESKIEKIDKQLEKIENRTQSLLDKSKLLENQRKAKEVEDESGTSRIPIADKSSTGRVQNKRHPSFLTLQCIPKRMISRGILDHIKQNAFCQNNQWHASIDTKEIVESLNSNTETIKKTISRLKEDGWFEVCDWNNNGYRTLKISPEIFGLS